MTNKLVKKKTEIYSNTKTSYHRTKKRHPRIYSKVRINRVSGPLLTKKSNFYPPRNRNKFLDATINFINQQILNNLSKNKANLSKDDWQALKELKNEESSVIKEADKGGSVVLMDSAHYEQMIYKQLEDKNI